MKKTTILTLTMALLSSLAVGQGKPVISYAHGITFNNYTVKAWLMIPEPKRNAKGEIDSLIVYVKKSQLHWLNDSTLIIKKP